MYVWIFTFIPVRRAIRFMLGFLFVLFFFFSKQRRHTIFAIFLWARICLKEARYLHYVFSYFIYISYPRRINHIYNCLFYTSWRCRSPLRCEFVWSPYSYKKNENKLHWLFNVLLSFQGITCIDDYEFCRFCIVT